MIAAFGNESMNSLMFDFLFVNLVGFDHNDTFGERPRVKKLFEMRRLKKLNLPKTDFSLRFFIEVCPH